MSNWRITLCSLKNLTTIKTFRAPKNWAGQRPPGSWCMLERQDTSVVSIFIPLTPSPPPTPHPHPPFPLLSLLWDQKHKVNRRHVHRTYKQHGVREKYGQRWREKEVFSFTVHIIIIVTCTSYCPHVFEFWTHISKKCHTNFSLYNVKKIWNYYTLPNLR